MAIRQAFQSQIDGATVQLYYDDETLAVDHVEARGIPEGLVVNVLLDDGTAQWRYAFDADGDAVPFPSFVFSDDELGGISFSVSQG
jgi:hypothetical protein